MLQIMFYVIFSLAFLLFHIYVGRRLIGPSSLSRWGRAGAWAVVATSYLLLLGGNVLYRNWTTGPLPGWLSALQWTLYISMGLLVLLLLLLLGRDLLRLGSRILRLFRRLLQPKDSRKTDAPDPSRRLFLTNSVNVGVLGASGLLMGAGVYHATQAPTVERVRIPIHNLPQEFEGFSIAQISDLHIGPTLGRRFVESVVDTVNRLGADAIVMTGDMIDGHVPQLRPELAPLTELHAAEGRYWVTGNHEYYWGARRWSEEAQRLGFDVLQNEHRVIRRGNARLLMAGVTDYNGGRFDESHRSNPEKALMGAKADDVKILLAHQPRSCYAATQAGVDLQLSGHTHGGQFVPWNLLVRLQQPYVAGLFRHDDRLQVYVNRGTGYWGPPLRLGVPSEVSLLELVREPEKKTT